MCIECWQSGNLGALAMAVTCIGGQAVVEEAMGVVAWDVTGGRPVPGATALTLGRQRSARILPCELVCSAGDWASGEYEYPNEHKLMHLLLDPAPFPTFLAPLSLAGGGPLALGLA